jgi:hypothetical protein
MGLSYERTGGERGGVKARMPSEKFLPASDRKEKTSFVVTIALEEFKTAILRDPRRAEQIGQRLES